ncbi:MAG: hypothetical protein AMJ58_11300 [Gammaproteobacteria bacterium SG8_30]|jgi:uncharacterized protein YceH (UPF0502 family)|nr:MAG: hypothetical protein AMJ58_11300 [Gammaproteobacteria bacterium SG8_30]
MKIELSAEEARVIGALLEKEIATPDQYPLSLNALTNACNQKSNRDPVMHLDERTVQGLLDRLSNRGLVVDKTGFGSRVPKWRHLFCNTEFGELRFSPGEVAVICELLLRGAQTPGELRSHASRLHAFRDMAELEAVLERLRTRDDGPFLVRLQREAGRREARYMHLFSGEPAAAAGPLPARETAARRPDPVDGDRLTRLERAMADLQMEVAELKRRLGG